MGGTPTCKEECIRETICNSGLLLIEIEGLTDALTLSLFYDGDGLPTSAHGVNPSTDRAPTIKESVRIQNGRLRLLVDKLRNILSEVSD